MLFANGFNCMISKIFPLISLLPFQVENNFCRNCRFCFFFHNFQYAAKVAKVSKRVKD